jgi:hypothetical protein
MTAGTLGGRNGKATAPPASAFALSLDTGTGISPGTTALTVPRESNATDDALEK